LKKEVPPPAKAGVASEHKIRSLIRTRDLLWEVKRILSEPDPKVIRYWKRQ
jgi:hypothetical protein